MNLLARIRALLDRRRILVISTSALLVIAGGAVVAISLNKPPALNETKPLPSATPIPEVLEAPPTQTAHVEALFPGWELVGGADTGSRFSAELGSTKDETISLLIDSSTPTSVSERRSLSQIVAVEPATTYEFSAKVWAPDQDASSSTVAIAMGPSENDRFEFPPSTNDWKLVSWSHTTGAGELQLTISVMTSGPANGFRLDDLAMSKRGMQTPLIANGQFEEFSAPTRISNDSLIMPTGEANIGTSLQAPSASWSIADATGNSLKDGTVNLTSNLGLISLNDLPQGFYSIHVVSATDPAGTLSASFMVLDDIAAPMPLDKRFGVGMHAARPYNADSASIAAALGIGSARTATNWGPTETVKGTYAFPADQDATMNQFKAAGIEVLPISGNGNSLYDGGQAPSGPAALAAFSNFGKALVEHYDSPAVEIYNEFNWITNKSACGRSAACYMELLKPSAEKIRAAHPGTKIIGPANALLDDAFLTALYQAGGLNYLDAISFHPYDIGLEGPETMIPTLGQAKERIAEYNNGESKPIWITELGWTSGQVSDDEQAKYLVRAEVIAFANGVDRYYWYDLVNDGVDGSDGEGNFGLLHQGSESIPVFEPKRSAMTQAVLTRKISNKAFVSQDALGSSTYSIAFGAGDDTTRVAWATIPVTVSFASTEPVMLTSQYGATQVLQPKDGSIVVKLGSEPVYLDGLLGKAAVVIG